jgi:diguanylate cyclase (GGDEF)-like protein
MVRAEETAGATPGDGPRRSAEPDRALTFLARMADEFTTVLNLPDLLRHVLQVLREELGFESCALSLIEQQDDDEVIVVRAGSGLRHIVLGMTLPRGKGLIWEVARTNTPTLVHDLHADPRVVRKDPGVRSGIYAPMAVDGRRIGVLSAYGAPPGAFTEADLHLLTIVARYVAGAIEVARLHERLKEMAATDALTGVANRRHFLDRLVAEIARCLRAVRPLSVALLDLDGFKAINDAHGHAVGDEVLARVAQAILRRVRASDLVGRYGGDEFVLLLPETSRPRAERVLQRFGAMEVPHPVRSEPTLDLRLCWGIATWPNDGDSADLLLRQADNRLYEMKRERKRTSAPPTG